MIPSGRLRSDLRPSGPCRARLVPWTPPAPRADLSVRRSTRPEPPVERPVPATETSLLAMGPPAPLEDRRVQPCDPATDRPGSAAKRSHRHAARHRRPEKEHPPRGQNGPTCSSIPVLLVVGFRSSRLSTFAGHRDHTRHGDRPPPLRSVSGSAEPGASRATPDPGLPIGSSSYRRGFAEFDENPGRSFPRSVSRRDHPLGPATGSSDRIDP